MARVRNIAPGFFTNESLVELPFEFRLLFAGLWTIADREGRLEDRPKRIRMSIFPADSVDCEAGVQALHDAGLVLRYKADGIAYLQILAFTSYQKPHPRETPSVIPAPPRPGVGEPIQPSIEAEVIQRQAEGEPKASLGVAEPGGLSDSRTLGLAEEEKESVRKRPPADRPPESDARGCRLPDGFPDADAKAWCGAERPALDAGDLAAKFRDYWSGVPGQRGRKADWPATWRNFVRNEFARSPQARASPYQSAADARDAKRAAFLHDLTGGLMGSAPTDHRTIDVESSGHALIAGPRR